MEEHNLYLKRFLQDLTYRPINNIPGPKKRASVAVVVRLRPQSEPRDGKGNIDGGSFHRRSARKDPYQPCDPGDIEDVFEEPWTKDAIAEILFIKRASRVGDRWTGHVALPGGGRDRTDECDEAAAIRECREEVGLDLMSGDVLLCGPLPQRVIITNWGQKPLMILCPYVFLWTREEMPSLDLQASEVAAAFWIPVQFLLDGKHQTCHPVDVSDRMAAGKLALLRPFFKVMLGPMYFSAIHLKPEEVSHSSTRDGDETIGELMLWGITYAVLADMLDLLPPFSFVKAFQYPFFKSWDYQALVWILSADYRRRRKEDVDGYKFSQVIGMRAQKQSDRNAKPSIIDLIMKGYYPFVRQAVYGVILLRIMIVAGLVVLSLWVQGRL
ncbi:hypothetical protein TWF696_003424 [Orbilia brochopaga]|uniref:Nudix hydrolase domain-containing protein n=1 Tax=Orbilia brochopaga TaxID=3140254 RepID=A0AAV9U0R2_9PEZI